MTHAEITGEDLAEAMSQLRQALDKAGPVRRQLFLHLAAGALAKEAGVTRPVAKEILKKTLEAHPDDFQAVLDSLRPRE